MMMEYFVTVGNGEQQDTLAGFKKGDHAKTFMKAIQTHYSEQKLVKMVTAAGLVLTVNAGYIFQRWAKNGVWSKITSASSDPNSKAHHVARSIVNIDKYETLNPATLSAALLTKLVDNLYEVEIIDRKEADAVLALLK